MKRVLLFFFVFIFTFSFGGGIFANEAEELLEKWEAEKKEMDTMQEIQMKLRF